MDIDNTRSEYIDKLEKEIAALRSERERLWATILDQMDELRKLRLEAEGLEAS